MKSEVLSVVYTLSPLNSLVILIHGTNYRHPNLGPSLPKDSRILGLMRLVVPLSTRCALKFE